MTTEGGGWTRLLRLEEDDLCPAPWERGTRGCRRPTAAAASSSTLTVSSPVSFGELRGSARALGFGASDAFKDGTGAIDGIYLDGLGVSVGAPPRHIFSFAHGLTDVYPTGSDASYCPCAGGTPPPAFVGTSYRCEAPAASIDPNDLTRRFLDVTDVLFDGLDIAGDACAGALESAPDFAVSAFGEAHEEIELRLMSNSPSSYEDLEVIHLELWLR